MRIDGTTRYRLPELRVENAVMMDLSGGARAAVFRLRMTGVETTPVTVSWATSDGSAVAGRDYTAASGTLTFGGYTTTKAVIIPVGTGSTGTFRLTLSSAEGADITSPVATAVLTTSNRRSVVRR